MLPARLAWLVSTWRSLIRRTRTSRRVRMTLRARAVLAGVALLVLLPGIAQAADGATSNPFLDPWGVKDSSGIPASAFGLSYDTGGMLESATLGPGVFFVNLIWNGWVNAVSFVLWAWQWCLGLQIMEFLDPVASTVAAVFASTITRVGLIGVAVSLAVVGAVWVINKGNIVRGFSEIFIAMLIATAAAQNIGGVILANVTGAGGTIWQARDFGAQIGAEIATGGANAASGNENLSAVDEVKATSAKLTDALIRTPHQLLQYGKSLDTSDSGKCKDAYDKAMISTGGRSQDTTAAVTACDESTQATVKDPMAALAGMPFILVGGGSALLPLLVMLAGFVFGVLWAMWEAVQLIIALVQGIINGSSRVQFIHRILAMLMAIGLVVVALAFNGITALLVETILTKGGETLGVIPTFALLALLMFVFAVLLARQLLRARKAARNAANKVGKQIAPQAKSMNPAAPSIIGSIAKPIASAGVTGLATRRMLNGHTNTGAGTGTIQGAAEPKPETAATTRSGLARVARGTRTVVVGGTKVALQGTIGAPVYLPRAAGAAKVAATNAKARTKTAINDKIETAQLKAMTARDNAVAFGAEYTGNLKKGAQFLTRAAKKVAPSTPATVQDQQHPAGAARTGGATSRSQTPPPAAAGRTPAAGRKGATPPRNRAQTARQPGPRPSAPSGTGPGQSSPIRNHGRTPRSLNDQLVAAAARDRSTPTAPANSPVKAGKK